MRKYTYNLDVFCKENDISYYLLGAFMTDGCVKIYPKRKLVNLTSKDYDWLEIIRDLICPELPIKKDNRYNVYRLDIYSTELGNILISKGCTNNKSFTLQFPQVPEKYLFDFVRGCVDGDGCISQSTYTRKESGRTYLHNVCYLCSSSEAFIRKFYEIFHTDEINCSLKEQSNKGRKILFTKPHYRVTFSNSNSKRFLEKVYYPNHILSMPRKKLLAEKIINSYNLVTRTRIELVSGD